MATSLSKVAGRQSGGRGCIWFALTFLVAGIIWAGAMVLISALELFPAAVDAGLSVARVTGLALIGALIVVGMQILARRLRPDGSRLAMSASLIAVAIGLHNIPEGAVTAATAMLAAFGFYSTRLMLAPKVGKTPHGAKTSRKGQRAVSVSLSLMFMLVAVVAAILGVIGV